MLMCGIVLVCSKLRFYFTASDSICIRMRAYDLHIVPRERIETSFITILVPCIRSPYSTSRKDRNVIYHHSSTYRIALILLFYLSHMCFSIFLTFFAVACSSMLQDGGSRIFIIVVQASDASSRTHP